MKTNKMWGLFAMTSLLVGTGCSTDEVVNDFSPENAIQFGTYVGRNAESRGSVHNVATLVGTAGNPGPGFGVFAYYTDESDYVHSSSDGTTGGAETTQASQTASPCNFMYNQNVTGTATTTGEGESATTTYSWNYSPIKYWPNDPGDKLTFFAYAPYDDADETVADGGVDNIKFNAQSSMNGDPVITFTVNSTVKNQTDLLFSKSNTKNLVKNKTGNDGIYIDEKVHFKFAHALSRIGFTVKAITDEVTAGSSAKVLDENTTIVVKKVILSGAAHTAAVDASFSAPSTGIFYSKGDLNINQQGVNESDATNNNTYKNVAWTNLIGDTDNEAKLALTLTNGNFKGQTEPSTTAGDGESGTTTPSLFSLCNEQGFVITGGNNGNSTTANPLNTDDSYIMIIPQDLSATGFYVYVEYDVITTDTALGNNFTTYDGLKSKVTNHISKQVTGINFQSGKAYTLNLQLGMTSVKVSAEVEEWPEATVTDVDLPQNTQNITNP